MGLWPEVPGRLSILPTAAVLGPASEVLATRERVLELWAGCAERLREHTGAAIAVRAPRMANPPGTGVILSLWAEPDADTASESDDYIRTVFSLGTPDYGANRHGRILAQLQRDLLDGYRVQKTGRDAALVDLDARPPAGEWARWIFVDLSEVRRPK